MKVKSFKITGGSTIILSASTFTFDFNFEFKFRSSCTEMPKQDDQKMLQEESPKSKMFENVYEEMQHCGNKKI